MKIKIQDFESTESSELVGWLTMTWLQESGEWINYGLFDTQDKAIEFGKRLINATITPLYMPVLH